MTEKVNTGDCRDCGAKGKFPLCNDCLEKRLVEEGKLERDAKDLLKVDPPPMSRLKRGKGYASKRKGKK